MTWKHHKTDAVKTTPIANNYQLLRLLVYMSTFFIWAHRKTQLDVQKRWTMFYTAFSNISQRQDAWGKWWPQRGFDFVASPPNQKERL